MIVNHGDGIVWRRNTSNFPLRGLHLEQILGHAGMPKTEKAKYNIKNKSSVIV